MAAGKISIQANDGKVAGVVFEDGASSNVTVTVPKEGGVVATEAYADTKVSKTGDETIEGVKTFSSTIAGSINGNAATATKLATARTINGVSFDGTANITVADSTKEPTITAGTTAQYWRGDKSWQTLNASAVGLGNVSNTAQVTSVTGTAPIVSSGGTTPAISISAATTSAAGSMSATDKTKLDGISGTNTGDETTATIKTKLGITTLSGSNTGDQTITLTGDVTGSGTGSFATTLANSGVTAGTYTKVTTDTKGRITSGTTLSASDIPTLNQNTTGSSGSCTGNAATATKLATARTINGVSFDGTANITVADSTKLPLAGGTLTGALSGTTATFSGSVTLVPENGSGTVSSPSAKLHVVQSTPTGLGGVPSGTTSIIDSNTNNYLLFRNTIDNGTYSGIVMQDNNIGGYCVFGNAGGGGDKMYVGGYNGVEIHVGYSDSVNPADRTTIASFTSGGMSVTSITETSSIRFKENVVPITNAIEKVSSLQGVTYDRIDTGAKNESGLIAEEVFKVLPNLVELDEEGSPTGVKYTKTIAYLIECVKELQSQIDELRRTK